MPRQSDQTRNALLDAAMLEIHQHGFQSASVASILEHTGLTKGAFYHHFPSKKALGLAVIDERIAPTLDKLLVNDSGTAPTRAYSLLDLLDGACIADEQAIRLGCPLNNLIQEMSPLDEEFRAHLNTIVKRWQSAITKVLLHGQACGEVRPEVDCEASALFIIAAWEGCAGIAKNLQSARSFHTAMAQLRIFVSSLLIPQA